MTLASGDFDILRRILCALVLVLVIGYAVPQPAAAHHSVYTAEDPSSQYWWPFGTENFVFYWWWMGSIGLWWADAGMSTPAQDAVAMWANKVPQLVLWTASNENAADLRFRSYISPWCLGKAGCMIVDVWEPRPIEDANYIYQATIYLDSNLNWDPQGKTAVTAHELGHFYGLNEQYDESTELCNADVRSAMDGTTYDSNNKLVHCDGFVGPTDLDARRVRLYWGRWQPNDPDTFKRADLPITGSGNGTVATYRWRDMAWAENGHYLEFSYKNLSGQWVVYSSTPTYDFIGSHMYTEDRMMGWVINRSNFFGVPAGQHRACAWAWFQPYGRWGTGRCSNEVTLQ